MKFTPVPLEASQASRILSAARSSRDRAMIVLLWRGGLRANEACSLGMEHVRFLPGGGAQIKVNNPKGIQRGAPQRVVGIDPQGTAFLKKWVEDRGRQPGPFLITGKGKRLHTSQARRTMKLAGARAKMKRRVHPHALRHTLAAELYREKAGIRHIQEALGHANLATTETYLQGIGCAEVVDMMTEREWNG